MKLKATIEVTWEVGNLEHYNATTIEQAAQFAQQWVDDGTHGVEDILSFGTLEGGSIKVTIEPEK